MLDPHKYGVNDVPEVCIVHMTNPAVSYADSPVVWEAYKRLKFVVVDRSVRGSPLGARAPHRAPL
jgi:hypothetical protein